MHKLAILLIGLSVVVLVALAACGSSPGEQPDTGITLVAVATNTPIATAPPNNTPVPSATSTIGPTDQGCVRAMAEVLEGQNPYSYWMSGPASGCYDGVGEFLDDIGLSYGEFRPGTVITFWTQWSVDSQGMVIQPTLAPTPTRIPVPPPDRGGRMEGVILEPGYAVEVVHRTKVMPRVVRVGPGDEILILGDYERIYQLGAHGEVSEYASFRGRRVNDFNFDPSGGLWISDGSTIMRVAEHGSLVTVARDVNRWFDFDSQGNLYAVDGNESRAVQLVTPDGQVSVLAGGFGFLRVIEVGPNDEILVVDETAGELIQVFKDGQQRVVAAGFGVDYTPRFAPDGTLYVLHWSGLQRVDLETGAKTRLSWYDRYSNTGNNAVFDSAGHMLTFHPIVPIYRLDLEAQTSEMIFHPRGNTWAMGIGPQSQVYVAYGNRLPNGETVVYRIDAADTLVEIGRIPYGLPQSMTFGPDGIGFLGVGDTQRGNMIHTLDPLTGVFEEYARLNEWPSSLAVDPISGIVWWTGSGVYYIDETRQSHAVPIPDGTTNKYLSFGPDGTLYAMLWFRQPDPLAPGPHGIYRREADGTWVQLADMTADDPAITLARAVVCPNKTIYAVASIDGHDIWPGRTHSSMNAILRLEEDGTLSLLAYDWSFDGLDTECDPRTGDIFFTSGEAIFRFYEE